MMIRNNHKQVSRLYLSTDADIYRKFYWFEINNNDLYWGSSSKVKEAYCQIENKNMGSFSIQTPENFKELINGQSKYSYHESGDFHRKKLEGSEYCIKDLTKKWPEKHNIVEPFRFFSLISKPLLEYPLELKNLTRKNGFADTILIKGEGAKNRIFFEFFLCKAGEYINPKSLLNFGDLHQNIIYRELNSSYIIMTRFTKLADFQHWHPDKEIIFIE